VQRMSEICAGAHKICIRMRLASPLGGDRSRMSAEKLAYYQEKKVAGGIYLQLAPCGYVRFTRTDAKSPSDERAVVGSVNASFLRCNKTPVRRTTMLPSCVIQLKSHLGGVCAKPT
jgi:hypothetical protein